MRSGLFALLLSTLALAAGSAAASGADTPSQPGSTIRADGTMTASKPLTKMAHTMEATQSCEGTLSMRTHAMTMAGKTQHTGVKCFKVQILNITQLDQFTASDGTKFKLAFSPGTFVVTSAGQPYFELGMGDRGHGLRSQAEDGDPSALAAYLKGVFPVSGAFIVPAGGDKPAPIVPGTSYVFFVAAQPGERLYVTTMMGQSNDWFYAPAKGIALFSSSGTPVSGDVTAYMKLYDAGTEADEEIGIGPSQGPRQPHPRFGPDDPNPQVRLITDNARFSDPTKDMRVTVTPQ